MSDIEDPDALERAKAELRRAGYRAKPEPPVNGHAYVEPRPPLPEPPRRTAEGTHDYDAETLRRMLDDAIASESQRTREPRCVCGCGVASGVWIRCRGCGGWRA